MRIKVMKKLNN